jgi:transcriptional regulator with XRE-family HTH domain
VKDTIGQKIRRIRNSKDLTQDNMAYELGITKSAYSKIERGETSITINRLYEIANILEVDITDFFGPSTSSHKAEDSQKNYGFATKGDIEEIVKVIEKLAKEVSVLKAGLEIDRKKISKRRKRK